MSISKIPAATTFETEKKVCPLPPPLFNQQAGSDTGQAKASLSSPPPPPHLLLLLLLFSCVIYVRCFPIKKAKKSIFF